MIRLTIGTNTSRTQVAVEPDQTLASVLSENNVNTTGCALHLNGTLIAGVDTDQTFEELGVRDGSDAMLIAVVNADSAR
jgi:sulfur carrier protein ThiS